MFPELITEVVNTDALLARLHGILVQSSGQVINLSDDTKHEILHINTKGKYYT